jgi:hypothetical protein
MTRGHMKETSLCESHSTRKAQHALRIFRPRSETMFSDSKYLLIQKYGATYFLNLNSRLKVYDNVSPFQSILGTTTTFLFM